MQQPHPFAVHLAQKIIDARRVAAGTSKARHKTEFDWVLADTEDDRDGRGCSSGSERGGVISSCGDQRDLPADQVSHQCREAIILSRNPMVLDRDVTTIDVAGFVEALVKGGCGARLRIRRPAAYDPDH